tara:strand:+ start:212 stop:1228 length:1017 start_codon:yes stop_codon:yes gene_type:complete
MTEIIIYAVLGLGGLLAGGSILIPGVVSLARQMGLPAVAVTVIVIAGGTSTPELIVSVDAALVGSPGIVWGNLIGSNIANIALVLGLGMLVQPVTSDVTNNRQLTGLLLVTLLIGGVCLTGGMTGLSRYLFSSALLAGFVVYLFWLVRHTTDPHYNNTQPSERHRTKYSQSDEKLQKTIKGSLAEDMSLTRAAVFAVGGVICLVAGADAFVWSGAELARSYGWSEDVIGLTIVAVGTSLPEIISLLASLQHRRHDIALGSVVGSNLFNFTLVLGTAGLSGSLPASDLSGQFMMPILFALTAILVVCTTLNQPLGRRSGFVFIGFYLAFLSLNLSMYKA